MPAATKAPAASGAGASCRQGGHGLSAESVTRRILNAVLAYRAGRANGRAVARGDQSGTWAVPPIERAVRGNKVWWWRYALAAALCPPWHSTYARHGPWSPPSHARPSQPRNPVLDGAVAELPESRRKIAYDPAGGVAAYRRARGRTRDTAVRARAARCQHH